YFVPIVLKRRDGRGQRVGADEHHAIGGRQRFHVSSRLLPRFVHQSTACLPGGACRRRECRHPCRSVEDHHVIARVGQGRTQSQLRDCQQQQEHADELQDERKGLLNFFTS